MPVYPGALELLGLSIAVVQSSFVIFTSLFYQKCYLLKARVIIYSYHHVRLLPPEPWSSTTKVYSGRGSRHRLCNHGGKFPIQRLPGTGAEDFPNRGYGGLRALCNRLIILEARN